AKSCICGDIVDQLPLAQATISQHLKELKNAGIIKGSIEGNSICYCLDLTTFDKLSALINDITDQIRTTNSTCC
ncbi:ArsR family transcriptional regulator, partial [Klebsiella pneumoniae]|uniref:ArsR/SmtB family transcription factor n=1 Tax=Klebsiella pneumoniae TaxID=573 RepID=UPI00273086DD